jgi:hypothetical protein
VVGDYNSDEPLCFIKAGTCLVLNRILTHGISLREGLMWKGDLQQVLK